MVATLALLSLLSADLRFDKDPVGSWQLLRDNKPVQHLNLTDCVTYVVPADWREPVKAIRRNFDARKIQYAAYLKQRYGYQISVLNQAYGLDLSSFTELEAADFTKLDENRPAVLADDIAYLAEVYKARLEWVFRNAQGKLKLVELPARVPSGLANELGPLVDALLVHSPIPGVTKPIVLLNCPAVKPAFATACAHI